MPFHPQKGHAASDADVHMTIEHDISASQRARLAMVPISGSGEFFRNVQLVTSELVGNVVRHTSGGGTLQAWDADTLRLEVHDTSSVLPLSGPDQLVGGRGLRIVALLCSKWGSNRNSTGKVVWVEFDKRRRDVPGLVDSDLFMELVSRICSIAGSDGEAMSTSHASSRDACAGRNRRDLAEDEREAAFVAREQRVAAMEEAVQARADMVKSVLSAAAERDARADARDAVADDREHAASLTSFVELGDEYIAGLKARRASAMNRVESKNDRASSASDRSKLSE
jgi:hypothetical protein